MIKNPGLLVLLWFIGSFFAAAVITAISDELRRRKRKRKKVKHYEWNK